ncbi:MAG: carbon-nitrogen hydrolase family protein [Sphingomonadaceae bacterium]|nr:carbon-nitrogen hydrolase family protein [Sphingomonadaceae bacterium]
MKAAICELPCKLDPLGAEWERLAARIRDEKAELVLLNELPFGDWLSLSEHFDPGQAEASIAIHEAAMASLRTLAPRVIASRPVAAGDRLANEAFALVEGRYVALHHKHYFPFEPGFYERAWFHPAMPGFAVHQLPGARIGVQLCSELMFNEWARRYGRSGAQIIVAPRASGESVVKWQAALAMAAAVSGSYVLSSNRAGREGRMTFGGRGMAYAPGGALLAETSADDPVTTVALDFELVTAAQQEWPCDIPELPPEQAGMRS